MLRLQRPIRPSIMKHSGTIEGFVVNPKRRTVERSFG
jgi:hypothetical protein